MKNNPDFKIPLTTQEITLIDDKECGRKLRERREKSKVSLRYVALVMGLSAPYISDLERGNRRWSEELVDRYLEAL